MPSPVRSREGPIDVNMLHWIKPTLGLQGVGWASAQNNSNRYKQLPEPNAGST
jgi:hypothetical protein